MRAFRLPGVWMKSAQAAVLAACVCFTLGASDATTRFDRLSHRLMCTCGCAQLLGECDHYGCPDRGQEAAELNAGIAAGSSDQVIFNSFVAKYGATVLAAPTTHGFDLVAWIAPFLVLAAGLLGTVLLVRRWKISPGEAPAADAAAIDPAAKALREKIRRETDFDGGAGL
ncbi:MAG TPA: cytochrome c-type biogenesis protein CcmH [Terracidiphilus sp.]|nr:cytochrome c-type biogenesis protein CcmH [Terracidiphilus sp.]